MSEPKQQRRQQHEHLEADPGSSRQVTQTQAGGRKKQVREASWEGPP